MAQCGGLACLLSVSQDALPEPVTAHRRRARTHTHTCVWRPEDSGWEKPLHSNCYKSEVKRPRTVKCPRTGENALGGLVILAHSVLVRSDKHLQFNEVSDFTSA